MTKPRTLRKGDLARWQRRLIIVVDATQQKKSPPTIQLCVNRSELRALPRRCRGTGRIKAKRVPQS
jgi:Trp operon repressor